MELRDYLAALRRYWTTWIGITVLGALIALLVIQLSPKTYQATAQVFIASTTEGTNGSQFVNQRVKSYPDVAVSRSVLGPVIDELGLSESFQDLRRQVTASNPVDTSQIEIVSTSTSAQEAADIANAVADQFGTAVEKLETPAAGTSPVSLTVTDPATVPITPVSPVPSLLLTLGLVVGLALGFAAAVVRSRVNTAVHNADEIRDAWGKDADELVVHAAPPGRGGRSALTGRPAAVLARRLELLAEARPLHVVALSPSPTTAQTPRLFVEEVAAELCALQVATAVGVGSVPGSSGDTAGGHGARSGAADRHIQVRLDVGSPLAPLRVWRQLAEQHNAVVLVIEAGSVDRTEVTEMRAILAAAGLRPLAVALVGSSRQQRRRHGRSPAQSTISDRHEATRGSDAPASEVTGYSTPAVTAAVGH